MLDSLHSAIAVAVMGGSMLSGAACGEPCPGASLDVSPYSGAPIAANAFSCVGEQAESLFTCTAIQEARFVSPIRTDDECRQFTIALGGSSLGGASIVHLDFTGTNDAPTVRALVVKYCDQGCAPETIVARGGTLAIESYSGSRSGRNSGAFRVEFDDGFVEGTYVVEAE